MSRACGRGRERERKRRRKKREKRGEESKKKVKIQFFKILNFPPPRLLHLRVAAGAKIAQ